MSNDPYYTDVNINLLTTQPSDTSQISSIPESDNQLITYITEGCNLMGIETANKQFIGNEKFSFKPDSDN